MVHASYRPSGNYGDNYDRPANGYANRYEGRTGGQNFASAPNRYPVGGAYSSARAYSTPQNNYARPTQLAYNHVQPPYSGSPYAGSQYGRSANQGAYGYPGASYPGRTTTAYGAGGNQGYRGPAGNPQSGFKNRGAYAGNSFVGASAKAPSSGGFHLFGGGHAPKSFGGGGSGGGKISSPKHFGGGGGGGHSGGKHRL